MILVMKASFPRSSISHAAKAFAVLPKLPGSVKRLGPYFNMNDKEKIDATSLFIFTDDHISSENIKFIKKRIDVFVTVPGFMSSVETWMNMEEAINAVNLNKLS